MGDTLKVFGNTYTNVEGIKAKDLNGNTLVYGGAVTSVNGQTGAVVLDASDVGAEAAISDVVVSTSGAVSQAIQPNTRYHFTSDSLTSLTITATNPTTGYYSIDFHAGSSLTLTVPNTWVMPNDFLVEPNAQYRLTVVDGYCVADKWTDDHHRFTYIEGYTDGTGDGFTIDTTKVADGGIYCNIGTEIVSVTLNNIKLKSALASKASVKIATIPAATVALIGRTYVTGTISSNAQVFRVQWDSWNNETSIYLINDSSSSFPTTASANGTIFLLRTL